MKRPKVHLLDTDLPICSWNGLQMRCGVILSTAVPRFMEAEDLPNVMKPSTAPMKISGICIKCMGLPPQGADKRQYVYGLQEGEEAKQEESLD